jgi:biopolymer transport protein ExbD
MLVLDEGDESRARRERTTFPLTPLADAMFQLLIFFMLTAGLSPYSLLTLQSGVSTAADSAAETPQPPQAPPEDANRAIWTLDAGRILSAGQEFEYDKLDSLIGALEASGAAQVILIATPDASVQDLALVLEALQGAPVARVQLVRQAGD